jgi:hypothetical protein
MLRCPIFESFAHQGRWTQLTWWTVKLDVKDRERFEFSNHIMPSVGGKFVFAASDHLALELGASLASEYRWVSDRIRSGAQVFTNWSADW